MKLIYLARQKNKDMTKDAIIKLHCPSYYGLLNLPECATEKQFRRCRECWEREYVSDGWDGDEICETIQNQKS